MRVYTAPPHPHTHTDFIAGRGSNENEEGLSRHEVRPVGVRACMCSIHHLSAVHTQMLSIRCQTTSPPPPPPSHKQRALPTGS